MSYPLSMITKIIFWVFIALGIAGIVFYLLLRARRKREFPYLSVNVPTPRDVYLKIYQKKRKNGKNSNI